LEEIAGLRPQLEKFEAVEADDPTRRRGIEYKDTDQVARRVDYLAYVDQLPGWIELACATKANKRYSKGASLVVYLNPTDFGVRRKPSIPEHFPSVTQCVKDHFKSVWVLWKNKVYRVWRYGKRDRLVVLDRATLELGG
jgi:hypothetical protein